MLSGQELLSPVMLNPTFYLPDSSPQRLLAFIEGYNAACFPERPLISMNASSEFGDLVAASHEVRASRRFISWSSISGTKWTP